jgi:multidrug resistance efflux pump
LAQVENAPCVEAPAAHMPLSERGDLSDILSLLLIAASGLYIFLRWRRSPMAYKAVIAVSIASFVSGSIWVLG